MRTRIVALLLLVCPASLLAAPPPATHLDGFYLWQYVSGAREYFGKAYETLQQKDSVLRIYRLGGHSYMVFESPKEQFKAYVESLQITGYPSKMLPFRGLTLGDPKAKVEKVLGPPSAKKRVKGSSNMLYYYDPANFSLEFDRHDRLYSIKLWADKKLFDVKDVGPGPWIHFRDAVLAKNMPAMLRMLRPDAEIYKDGKTLSPHGRFADFLKHPDQAFVDALIGKTRSVRAALQESQPTGEMRMIMGVGVGQVYKFYKGTIVREVVLFPYNGEYRLYEISFRDPGGKKVQTTK